MRPRFGSKMCNTPDAMPPPHPTPPPTPLGGTKPADDRLLVACPPDPRGPRERQIKPMFGFFFFVVPCGEFVLGCGCVAFFLSLFFFVGWFFVSMLE